MLPVGADVFIFGLDQVLKPSLWCVQSWPAGASRIAIVNCVVWPAISERNVPRWLCQGHPNGVPR